MSFSPDQPTYNYARSWSWNDDDAAMFPPFYPFSPFLDMTTWGSMAFMSPVESRRHKYFVSALPIFRYHLRNGTQVNEKTVEWLHQQFLQKMRSGANHLSSFSGLYKLDNLNTQQFGDLCAKLSTFFWGSDSPWDISVEKQADNESFVQYLGDRVMRTRGNGLCVWFDNDSHDNQYNPKTGVREKGLAPATDQEIFAQKGAGDFLNPTNIRPGGNNWGRPPTAWDQIWQSSPFVGSGRLRDIRSVSCEPKIPLVCQGPLVYDMKEVFSKQFAMYEVPLRGHETVRFAHLTNLVASTLYNGMRPGHNTEDRPEFDLAWRYRSGVYTDYHWQPTVLWPLCPTFWNATLNENAVGNDGAIVRLHWSSPRQDHVAFQTSDPSQVLVGFAIMFQVLPSRGDTVLDRADMANFNDSSGWQPNPGETFDPDPQNTDGLALAPVPKPNATNGRRGIRFPFPWSPWYPWEDFGSNMKFLGPFLQDTYKSYTNLSRLGHFLPGSSIGFLSYVLVAATAELLKRTDEFSLPLPAWNLNRRPKMYDPSFVITKFKSDFKIQVYGKFGITWMSDMTWNPIDPSPYWQSMFGSDIGPNVPEMKSNWVRFLWDMGSQKGGDARLIPRASSVHDWFSPTPTQIVYMPCSQPRNKLRFDGYSEDTPGDSLPFQSQ